MSDYVQIPISIPRTLLDQVRERLDPETARGSKRNNTSGAIAAALDRYYTGLARERAILRPLFTPAMCADLLALPRHYDVVLLWALAADRGYEVLAATLHGLTWLQSCAILDALERWDVRPGDDPGKLLEG